MDKEVLSTIVFPDTSPRGDGVPDDPEGAYDLGHGAGFYLNATQAPWSKHYRMEEFVVHELPSWLGTIDGLDLERLSISVGTRWAVTAR